MAFLQERVPLFLVLFFLSVCLAIPYKSYSQNLGSLSVDFSQQGAVKGASYGDDFLEYKGYSLSELLVNLYDGYIYDVQSDSLVNRRFDFKWKGTLENRRGIIEDLNYALDLNLGIEVNSVKDKPDVYFMSYSGKPGCEAHVGSSIIKVNRMWTGKCVLVSEVGKQMEEWYGVITEVPNDAVLPQIELHHDDLEIFLLYIQKSNIQIDIKKTSKIKFVYK